MPADLDARVRAARRAYLEAGNAVVERAGARMVVNRTCPQVWDANHVGAVGEQGPVDVAELLAAIDDEYDWAAHRQVHVGPAAPEALAAELTVAGYELHADVELVLPAGADVTPGREVPGLVIRPVRSDDDVASLVALTRADHEEEAEKEGRDPWPPDLTAQMVEVRLGKAPAAQFCLAAVGGDDVAFFSAYAGASSGVGVVEDLFTLPAHRGRGVARALIRHCVADARARGAREVAIGADPADWPQRWYAALGFRPTLLRLVFTRGLDAAPAAEPAPNPL